MGRGFPAWGSHNCHFIKRNWSLGILFPSFRKADSADDRLIVALVAPSNLRSPQDHTGVIHSSNLCTEITLNTSDEETAVCNLGSVVLDTHITKDGMLDHEMLRETVTVAIRALDNVIDINFYPTGAAKLQILGSQLLRRLVKNRPP